MARTPRAAGACRWHPVDNLDSLDTLDLDGLIYLGSEYDATSTVGFENFDGLPSGNNLFNVIYSSDAAQAAIAQLLVTGSKGAALSTVNVSTTGIGAGSQHIDVGATLRLDAVQGIVRSTVDSAPEVNQAANIVYTDTGDAGSDARVELVGADFEITQLNPGSSPARVDIRLSAFNVFGADQQQAYLNNINANGTAVTILEGNVIVKNGAGVDITASPDISQDGASVIIRGLDDGTTSNKTDGYQVFFTTDGIAFDRFLITNIDGEGTTFDVGNIHISVTQGGSAFEYANLGEHVIIEDDGPRIAATGIEVEIEVSDALLDAPETIDFSGLFGDADYGADGPAATDAFTYDIGTAPGGVPSGLIDTETGDEVLLYVVDNPDFGTVPGASPHIVIGKVGVSDPDDPLESGQQVFVISAVAGNVTLEQNRAVFHATSDMDQTVSFLANLITITATVTDGDGDAFVSSPVDIGVFFSITDDVPEITPQDPEGPTPNDLEVSNLTGASDSSSYGLDGGNDTPFAFSILSAPTDGGFSFQTNANGITGFFDPDGDGVLPSSELYTLTIDQNGNYVFTLTGAIASTSSDLDVNDIKAGGPDTGSIEVGTLGATGEYVLIDGEPGNINESNGFVGVKNGNLDIGESMIFSLHEANDALIPILGLVIGTKSAKASEYKITIDYASIPDVSFNQTVAKNTAITIDPAGNDLINFITVEKVSGPALKIGLGDITIIRPPDDFVLDFSVLLTDGDGDTDDASFSVAIDGDNDGVFPMPTLGSSLVDDMAMIAVAPIV